MPYRNGKFDQKQSSWTSKILEFGGLPELRLRLKSQKIVHCHGVFDVLHAGHLAYFESAKKFGDHLVVTITADQFVNKGPGRPYFNGSVRSKMIAALEVVDFVCISPYPTAVPCIEALQPNFYVKGPDYQDKSKDPTGAIFREEEAVQKGGGQLAFTSDETLSSSRLINEFFNPWTELQQKTINMIKEVGGLEKIEKVLDQVAELSVSVIGEPIVDTYVFCQPEAISSKSPSISAKFLYQEDYAGGVLAIANHLAGFVNKLTLLTTFGGEEYFQTILDEKIDPRIHKIMVKVPNNPTPRKTRFIEKGQSQRMFELTDLRSDQWLQHDSQEFCQVLKSHNQGQNLSNHVTILADFGHGLFEKEVLQTAKNLDGFVALNVQTNSSNFGFNPFTKHRRFSYLSIDTREARVAYHDRYSSGLDLARRIQTDIAEFAAGASITLGAQGAVYFPVNGSAGIDAPAFTDQVVDATGAGDAYFAITSLLVKVGCPEVMVPFIGNVFAGLKTKIIGNKTAVSRAQLIKALTAILK